MFRTTNDDERWALILSNLKLKTQLTNATTDLKPRRHIGHYFKIFLARGIAVDEKIQEDPTRKKIVTRRQKIRLVTATELLRRKAR